MTQTPTEPPAPPPTTVITGRMRRRKVTLDGFNDLTGGVEALTVQESPTDPRDAVITFPGTLTAKQRVDVFQRFTSLDDADQADRAVVAALMDKVKALPQDDLTRLLLRVARRSLGDQPEV